MADDATLYNKEAELAVLGSILSDPNCIVDVYAILRPDDFYRPRGRGIYEALVGLHQAGEPIDALTLAAELERSKRLAGVGGPSFINGLTQKGALSCPRHKVPA